MTPVSIEREPETVERDAPTIVALDDAGDVALAGGKAASLARLRAAGVSVPDGFVITTEACRAIDGSIGPRLRSELEDALERLGGGPVAVRSSAVAEDGDATSFAGQFLTRLAISGADDVAEAVVACVAAAREGRATAYRNALAQGSSVAIAVLVQRMVDADASGVAFSVNPATGDDEVLMSAVRGLGDKLVSGEATPEDWTWRDAQLVAPRDPQALDEGGARRLAKQVRELAELYGAPQDVEWALKDGELHVLQSRPVTAVPLKPSFADDPTEGVWTRDRAHYPVPMTAFGGSTYCPSIERITKVWLEEHGVLAEGLQQHWRGGDVYGRVIPPGGKDGPAPPWWLLAVLSRIVPPIRKRMAAAKRMHASGLMDQRVRDWREGGRAELEAHIRELAARDLAGRDGAGRLAHLDELLTLQEETGLLHMRLFFPWLLHLRRAVVMTEELLGWPQERALGLLAGHSQTSSAPKRELADLAPRLRDLSGARAALDEDDPLEKLAELDPDLAAEVAAWIARWGLRATGYDTGAPTLDEQPGLLWNMIRDGVDDALLDHATNVVDGELQAELERLAPADRRRLEEALATARDIFGLREDNVLYTDNLVCGLTRRAVLSLGELLVEQGQLARREHVVDLTHDEIRAAVAGELENTRALARRRRAERAWVAAHPGPDVLCGEPTPLPSMRGLPEPGRTMNEAFMWAVKLEFPEMAGYERPAAAEGELRGIGAWPGCYEGTVRVVMNEDELDRVRPGDVLVAPITHPAWSIVFPRIGALVTDCGGALSHAAIVAREHGIPTVLNTFDATTLLRDGQRVRVDGTDGSVTLLS